MKRSYLQRGPYSKSTLTAMVLLASMLGYVAPSDAVHPPTIPASADMDVPAFMLSQALSSGTILDTLADIGLASTEGSTSAEIRASRPFQEIAQAAPPVLEVVMSVPQIGKPTNVHQLADNDKKALLSRISAAYPDKPPSNTTKFKLSFYGSDFTASSTVKPIEFTGADVATVQTSIARVSSKPNGGMVYLVGGALRYIGAGQLFTNAQLDICGDEPCLKFPPGQSPSTSETLNVPIRVNDIFVEVWDKVVKNRVDAFYLSINPTPATLAKSKRGSLKAFHPSDRLHENDPNYHNYRVVTAGGIERSHVGRILYEADVLFKSAGLGFDVLQGRSQLLPGIAAVDMKGYRSNVQQNGTPDRALDALKDSDSQWCRLYWSSNEQRITSNNATNKLEFMGAPVVAAAEAMIVKNGSLDPYPLGTWCDSAKRVAYQLNRLAASPGSSAPKAVVDIVTVGRAQNFIKWVRDTRIPVTPAFQAKLDSTRRGYVGPGIPEWVSGVYSGAQNRVSVNRKDAFSSVVHIATDDPFRALASYDKHVVDYKDRNKSISHKYEDTSELSSMLSQFHGSVDILADSVAKDLATSAQRDPIPTVSPSSKGSAFSMERQLEILPVSVHGGALLRALGLKEYDKTQSKQTALEEPIMAPDGRPLFKRMGDTLHFWSVDPTGDMLLEHLAIRGVQIEQMYAQSGVLRFIVKKMGSSANAVSQIRFSNKIKWEWRRTLPLGPKEKEQGIVAWLDPTKPTGNRTAADLKVASTTDKYRSVFAPLVAMQRIKMHRYGDNAWLIELRTIGALSVLDQQWPAIVAKQDIPAAVAHIQALGALGYRHEAVARLGTAVLWIEQEQDPTRNSVDKVLFAGVESLVDPLKGTDPLDILFNAALRTEDIRAAMNLIIAEQSNKLRIDQANPVLKHINEVRKQLDVESEAVYCGAAVTFLEGLANKKENQPIAWLLQKTIKDLKARAANLAVLVNGSTEPAL